MERLAEAELAAWKGRADRKPLVVRGARQVGKTFLVEAFGHRCFDSVVTVNLEQNELLHPIFEGMNPLQITQELGLYYNQSITPGKTLLFLDEVQACPKAIACLRYFREQLPALHVIAAGSLLDFALGEFKHSMPVGRIEYLHVYPLTFSEFLLALGEDRLAAWLENYHIGDPFSESADAKLRQLLRLYFFVGGMPAAVAAYRARLDLVEVQRELTSIVTTLQDDFAKYGTRAQQRNMRRLLRHIPLSIGQKVRYVNIDRDAKAADLRTALELLELAGVIAKVRHSSANGVPLGGEASEHRFKPLLLDIGLCRNLYGLALPEGTELLTANEGRLAEQYVGQELRAIGPACAERPLFYWHREAKNANAEVDYLWAHEGGIVPVEVRAGVSGSLKSIHVFLAEKARRFAVRFNMDRPSLGDFSVDVRGKAGTRHLVFTLLSLPLYLTGQIDRLIREQSFQTAR
ncbi:MAG: AAA family ATPase [Thermoguttaceae bacterium]|jgi:predicted AAA+ superfamily ATPase|nr:AAA family ATPase [Thermoguttaceae bacterium]